MKFVRLFGQWFAVPMRYASLPPALVRGVAPVRLSGAGGSSSPAYPSQKSAKYKNGKHRKIMLFYALLLEIRTPPVPVCATLTTPLVNAGGKASNHPRPLTARQIPIYREAAFPRQALSCHFIRKKSGAADLPPLIRSILLESAAKRHHNCQLPTAQPFSWVSQAR